MNALELNNDTLKGGAFVLTGDDTFMLSKAQTFFRNILPENSLSLFVLDRINSVNEIFASVGIINFDGSPNVILVRDSEVKFSESDHNQLVRFLKTQIAPDFLVFCNEKILNAAEKKLLTPISCEKPDRYTCMKYVDKLFPFGIERAAISMLLDYTDCNLAIIINESKKLIDYCGEKRVLVSDVDNLVTEDTDIQVFSLANSLAKGNKQIAMKQFEKLIKCNTQPVLLLATLISQFQRMLYCSISNLDDDSLAKVLSVKPYAVKKTRENISLSKVQLRTIVSKLLDFELKFKNGDISDGAAIECAMSYLISKEL